MQSQRSPGRAALPGWIQTSRWGKRPAGRHRATRGSTPLGWTAPPTGPAAHSSHCSEWTSLTVDGGRNGGMEGEKSVLLPQTWTSSQLACMDAARLTDEAAVEHPGPHEEEWQQEEHKVVVVPGTCRSNADIHKERKKNSDSGCRTATVKYWDYLWRFFFPNKIIHILQLTAINHVFFIWLPKFCHSGINSTYVLYKISYILLE